MCVLRKKVPIKNHNKIITAINVRITYWGNTLPQKRWTLVDKLIMKNVNETPAMMHQHNCVVYKRECAQQLITFWAQSIASQPFVCSARIWCWINSTISGRLHTSVRSVAQDNQCTFAHSECEYCFMDYHLFASLMLTGCGWSITVTTHMFFSIQNLQTLI